MYFYFLCQSVFLRIPNLVYLFFVLIEKIKSVNRIRYFYNNWQINKWAIKHILTSKIFNLNMVKLQSIILFTNILKDTLNSILKTKSKESMIMPISNKKKIFNSSINKSKNLTKLLKMPKIKLKLIKKEAFNNLKPNLNKPFKNSQVITPNLKN